VVIKDALKLIGIDVGDAKAPISSLSKDKKEILKNILKEFSVL